MEFRVRVTCGGEVKFAGFNRTDEPTYYGGPPPESGLWKISIPRFERYIADKIHSLSFGESVSVFVFGFEIAELADWGPVFTTMADYVSYRPSVKWIVSVGQVEWRSVKDLTAKKQFTHIAEALNTATARVSQMKRKPAHFDCAAFADAVQGILAVCPIDLVVADELAA